MRFTTAALALLAATAATPALAQGQEPADAIRAYVDQCHAALICNGAYLVAMKGKPIFTGAVGDAGDAARTPLTKDNAFDIGSISKQFTAFAVLKLVSQGKLALTDKVARHLPEFPFADVTVAQLLNHTSGVPDILDQYNARLRAGGLSEPITGGDVVHLLAKSGRPLRSAPGAVFAYNNTAYLVAAVLVEKVAKQPFPDYLESAFFKPLGMTHTRLRMPANEAAIANRALGFRPAADGSRRPLDQIPGFYMQGAGGMYSTVEDLLRWENALTAGRVVPQALWKRATAPTRLTDGTLTPYGFGLALKATAGGARRFFHDGDWRAFKANLAYYPDSQVTIVQLTNNGEDDTVDVNEVALARLAIGDTVPTVPALAGPALYGRLDDLASARAWFVEELAARPARYEFREPGLNTLAYSLLDKKEVDKALLVFELNTIAFPISANALDGLADGYEAKGDLKTALEKMRAALALDPDSKPLQEHAAKLEAKLASGSSAPR